VASAAAVATAGAEPWRTRWGSLAGDAEFVWAVGIEDTFVPQPHPRTGRLLDEYVLTEHDVRWYDDLELVAGLGVGCMRWGVPWHRVELAPGRFRWTFVDGVLGAMEQLRIRPIIDLVHYGTPEWLEQGFVNPDYGRRVAAYAAAFAERYADLAPAYTPLNEPDVTALFCGRHGTWPPYLPRKRKRPPSPRRPGSAHSCPSSCCSVACPIGIRRARGCATAAFRSGSSTGSASTRSRWTSSV
jgi:hypothetical protein